eukprot:NODE_1700_length_784_cov_108.840816_g1421_i0.p2 GENE.NODE_1700_length_784_cov_108.840816_g1421_i0~~NODE_1700_length_784_cov_108.840816_g1421_i0.p2  ORF type:complete len:193 (+),score=61.26 NODE_1700_length_784_cov_108.840816_g1421_i0:34-579(+)
MGVKALRLKQSFVDLYGKGWSSSGANPANTSLENLTASGVTSKDIYEEIPIEFSNNLLTNAFLFDLATNPDQLTSDPEEGSEILLESYLAKGLQSVLECEDDLVNELGRYQAGIKKFNYYTQIQAKKEEKQIPVPPSRLGVMLASKQIVNQCVVLEEATRSNFENLFAARALHSTAPAPSS